MVRSYSGSAINSLFFGAMRGPWPSADPPRLEEPPLDLVAAHFLPDTLPQTARFVQDQWHWNS